MKNNHKAERTPSSALYEIISPILTESPPIETSTDQSNDLGERLMKLPIELRQTIICAFSLKERSQLRLVNKAMLAVVDESMFDVQEIDITIAANLNTILICE